MSVGGQQATGDRDQAPKQRGHRLGNRLDFPAVLGSLLMILLGWVVATGQVDRPWHGSVAVVVFGLWAFYLLEYAVKVAISQDKLAYVCNDLLALVTAVSPFLAFLRAVSTAGLSPLTRAQLALLKRRQLDKLAVITVQVTFIFAIVELLLEQHARGSNITTFTDALYWSATTVTTVASQFAPVTTGGEIMSFLLMLYAVMIFTYFTSALASALIGGDIAKGGQQATQFGDQGAALRRRPPEPPSPLAPVRARAGRSSPGTAIPCR